MKKIRWLISAGIITIFIVVTIQLVLAAFSATKRRLGPNTEFSNVIVAGGVNLGDSSTNGSIRLKPSTSPPTCNSDARGILYVNTNDHILYICNGTSWSSI